MISHSQLDLLWEHLCYSTQRYELSSRDQVHSDSAGYWISALCTGWDGEKAPGLPLSILHTVSGLEEAYEMMLACWTDQSCAGMFDLPLPWTPMHFCLSTDGLARKKKPKKTDVAKRKFMICTLWIGSQGMWGWGYFSQRRKGRAKYSLEHICLSCTVLIHSGGLRGTLFKTHFSSQYLQYLSTEEALSKPRRSSSCWVSYGEGKPETLKAELKQMRAEQRNSRRQYKKMQPHGLSWPQFSPTPEWPEVGSTVEWEVFLKFR